MGADDDADCVGHVWRLDEVHLSLEHGAEQAETCARCGAVRYLPDLSRVNRPKLR